MASLQENSGESFIRAHCSKIHLSARDYRPDIDGLRALAVLAVVAFHAFPSLLPSGFVGVDVFFVISGYLISQHIFSELTAGSFRIRAFYARRVKRIFPALAVVLLACIGIGWVILTPGEYEALGRPIAGGAAFLANFVFWKEAGYFDIAADSKPVLHLWSLGVEEQFYIFWPFAMALLWRWLPRYMGRAIVVICLLSLSYSVWLVPRDVTADFYSPFSRLWELGVGAALAFHGTRKPEDISAGIRNFLSVFGLGMILVGTVIVGKGAHFPGVWALLPTIGAVCLIFSGQHGGGWVHRKLLNHRLLVWMGLISYPLYLWHWPLLSFTRIMESETPAWTVRLLIVVISVLLAWLTYRWVELPIRSKPSSHSRKVVLPLALLMLALFITGVAIRKADGFKFRALSKLNGDVTTLTIGKDRASLIKECGIPDAKVKSLKLNFCLSTNVSEKRFAVLGDSKAEAFYYGLARELGPSVGSLLIGSVRPPAEKIVEGDMGQARNQSAFQAVLNDRSVSTVIWVIALRNTFPADEETGFIIGSPQADLIANYTRAIQAFERAGKRSVFVIDNPTLPDPRSCISGGMTPSSVLNKVIRRKLNPRCSIRYEEHLAGTTAYRNFAHELSKQNPNLFVYDPTSLLCDVARNECAITRDGKFLYSYSDHISDYANSMLAKDLLSRLKADTRR